MHTVECLHPKSCFFLLAPGVAVSNNAVFSSYVNLSTTGVFSDIY